MNIKEILFSPLIIQLLIFIGIICIPFLSKGKFILKAIIFLILIFIGNSLIGNISILLIVMLEFLFIYFKYKYSKNHITFGKYKGKKWNEIPSDYLLWIINNHSNKKYRKRAKEEIEKSGAFKVVAKNKSNESIGPIYDQDGNISTDEEMNEQLRQAIREYHNNVSSDDYYQKHLEKIKQSKNTTIIEPEGIYFKGEFIANEEVEEMEKKRKN